MGTVAVAGGGMCGLAAAMMLADDGHEVTVIERDPSPPPPDPETAFTQWDRRSVTQFGLAHFLLAMGTDVLARKLPTVYDLLDRNGGHHTNWVKAMSTVVPGLEVTPADDRFDQLTGRRSTLEWAMATTADDHAGVTVRRGEPIAGLLAGPSVRDGVPHVEGLRLRSGEAIEADLVVDATGRRSPTVDWLTDLGARPPMEDAEDSGFAYYGRYFRSADGSVPAFRGPALAPYGSFSVLTLPADNGTWSVTLYGLAADKPLRRLRRPDVHERVVRACPLQAHWLDGTPISEMTSMVGLADRHRRFVVDGRPCATGILSVADASSCTNPSLGRGVSLGLKHVELMCDVLADGPDDPWDLALAFDEATERELLPWHRATTSVDRQRLQEMRAHRAGEPFELDPATRIGLVVNAAGWSDPACTRLMAELIGCVALPDAIFARPGVLDHVMALAASTPVEPLPGPDRAQLLELVA